MYTRKEVLIYGNIWNKIGSLQLLPILTFFYVKYKVCNL